ncbi:hypothetical protein AAFF_G00112130 [Aldrovandia affinis]|uniref:Uncharacterized protein n=1 Tax=Aldrovandia affinis TaxID=143900 RepID=A0AAD7RTK6_9TELE|nr:hypothetical protein AAFF_G00112130 [Aldrovandia affinis]
MIQASYRGPSAEVSLSTDKTYLPTLSKVWDRAAIWARGGALSITERWAGPMPRRLQNVQGVLPAVKLMRGRVLRLNSPISPQSCSQDVPGGG